IIELSTLSLHDALPIYMIPRVGVRALSLVLLLFALAACRSTAGEQRTLQGPTALEIWTAGVILRTGREPTFDERYQWDSQMERRSEEHTLNSSHVAISY